MNPDKPSSKEAEHLAKWREQKKQINRDRVKGYYESNKDKVKRRKKEKRSKEKRLDGSSKPDDDDPLAASFSRIAKKRALDKARKALPQSPRKRAEVLTSLLDSPTTRKVISDSTTLNSPEQQEEVRLARAVLQDVSSVVDETKHQRSDGARTTMRVGLSMLWAKYCMGRHAQKRGRCVKYK